MQLISTLQVLLIKKYGSKVPTWDAFTLLPNVIETPVSRLVRETLQSARVKPIFRAFGKSSVNFPQQVTAALAVPSWIITFRHDLSADQSMRKTVPMIKVVLDFAVPKNVI
ncbi:hypothetical protein MIR68_011930 [Amoeboaphelidium protococcarum]|nr:hypothetical protein MIR68_011930 [Amoeboaphelidium protococcarum]